MYISGCINFTEIEKTFIPNKHRLSRYFQDASMVVPNISTRDGAADDHEAANLTMIPLEGITITGEGRKKE